MRILKFLIYILSQVQKPYTAQAIELALKTDLINYHYIK
ncbi:MAG: hypothetical protein KatS3mg003_1790 [Candidatus Nitrosocaldaceae archaeon]|nr:MAG: hypothetical protein KatS3mg003_1790 [Candidatus Nitrosocaldaceae archaeon]